MKQLRLITLAIIIVIIGIEALLLFMPIPPHAKSAEVFHTQLLIVVSLTLNYLAAAVLFWYGLRDFKPQVRKSYKIIALSMVYFGVINLHYPPLLYAGLIPYPWIDHGGSIAIIIPGVILRYLGVRHFAQALGVNSKLNSMKLLLAVTVIASIIVAVLPRHQDLSDFWYIFHQTICVINITFNLFAGAILVKMLRNIGQSYIVALRWLAASVVISGLAFVHVLLVNAIIGHHTDYTAKGFVAVPFVLLAVFYVIAGYQFCKIRFFGLSAPAKSASGRAILDAVMAVAGLVSSPRDIEAELTNVRTITAQLGPGQALSAVQNQVLVETYLKIEDYLIKRERLRTFTRDGLRARLSEEALRTLP